MVQRHPSFALVVDATHKDCLTVWVSLHEKIKIRYKKIFWACFVCRYVSVCLCLFLHQVKCERLENPLFTSSFKIPRFGGGAVFTGHGQIRFKTQPAVSASVLTSSARSRREFQKTFNSRSAKSDRPCGPLRWCQRNVGTRACVGSNMQDGFRARSHGARHTLRVNRVPGHRVCHVSSHCEKAGRLVVERFFRWRKLASAERNRTPLKGSLSSERNTRPSLQ